MSNKTNVIDFLARRQEKLKTKVENQPVAIGDAPVVDMTEIRNDIINQERRQVRRTILSEFIGACVVLPGHGLQKVVIHDISENGLAFDLNLEMGHFKEDEEIAMRVYLNSTTYFPFFIRIINVRLIEDEGVFRHGTSIVKGTINDVALHHFLKFIENVSAALKRDDGDILVSNFGGYPPSV